MPILQNITKIAEQVLGLILNEKRGWLHLALERFHTKRNVRTNEPIQNVVVPSSGQLSNDTIANTDENKKNQPTVILFHDSLCKGIKDTIMVNEHVKTIKTWAPYLSDIQKEVEEIENVDTIVIESITRHLTDMDPDSIVQLTKETVDVCLTKANNVIISSIIKRDDDPAINEKAENVNLKLRYQYLNSPQVLVCNNDNLCDRKFRVRDGVHLTEFGTSRFANNLKYKIAESLRITVELNPKRKKRDFFDNPRQNRDLYWNKSDDRFGW